MKLLLALSLAACISVPPKPGAMCETTSDCASGEVCQEGVCWGDPPMGTFAATLAPPAARADLVASEIPALVIPQSGWVDSLQLAAPVTISGRVEAYCAPSSPSCITTSLGAKITFTRKSSFAGGPLFSDGELSKDSVPRGTDSFSAFLPATGETDPPYTVTIVPDGRDTTPPSSGMSPAMLAPPMHMTLAVPASTSTTFVLGSATSRTISGTISNGTTALTKYRVVAIGQWDAASPPTEVSTISYSTDGSFHITIADAITGPVTLKADPYADGVVAPTLRLNDVQPGTSQVQVLQPANLGSPIDVTIPVVGVTGAGAVAPVSGAHVIVEGTFDPTFAYSTHAVLHVETTTADDGLAHVTVLDGSALRGTYKLRVVPPASSSLGVIFDQPLVFDATGVVDPQRLPSRVALSGKAIDTSGAPVRNLSITARPSLRFQWSLDPVSRAFLTSEIPPATAVTADSGDFVVWVDPYIAQVWGHYDVAFEPQDGSDVPSWTLPDVEIPRVNNLTTVPLDVTIPDAAFIHGALADPSGGAVVGGELRIYEVITDLSLCSQVAFPPQNCVIPAPLVGHGTSDAMGIVRLTLARP